MSAGDRLYHFECGGVTAKIAVVGSTLHTKLKPRGFVDFGTSWWMHVAQRWRPSPPGCFLAALACLALVGAASAREFSFITITSARTASVQVYVV
jgi:hypothetical protein